MINVQGNHNQVDVHNNIDVLKTNFAVIGNNNIVIIKQGVKLRSCNIRLKGNDMHVVISENVEMTGVVCSIFSNGSLSIDSDTTMGNGELTIAEGCSIHIGKDCMLAHGYEIRTSDMHPIYDLRTGSRINLGKSVSIGNHVWTGRNVFIHKGVTTVDNIVIGAGSVVSKSLDTPNSIVVGSPAKVVKTNVIWGRKMYHKTMHDDPTLADIIANNALFNN